MKEPLRYLENAKEILKTVPIEGRIYADVKPVREALGTAYLAILEGINEALLRKGLTTKELPKSMETYQAALHKHLAVRDGKLLREFTTLYNTLHIAGYYRGLIQSVAVVKDLFREAREFIDKIG